MVLKISDVNGIILRTPVPPMGLGLLSVKLVVKETLK